MLPFTKLLLAVTLDLFTRGNMQRIVSRMQVAMPTWCVVKLVINYAPELPKYFQ